MEIQVFDSLLEQSSPASLSLEDSFQQLPSDVRDQISARSKTLSFTGGMLASRSIQSSADLQKLTANALPLASTAKVRFPFRPIIGTPQGDFLLGTNASDFIFGLAGNDIILAQDGNDYIFSGSGDDVAFGGRGNDTFFQGRGNAYVDGRGNDFLIGSEGFDTADYSQLGQAITLKPEGTIVKGAAGTDTLFQVESIVGAQGQANAIDAATAGDFASIDVDLGSDRLTVNGIPGLGSLNLTVKNFVNVTGTQQSDTITGDEQDNTFFGSRGDDSFDGGKGSDTVDYSKLGQGVTLKSQGVISKGSAGTDQIQNIDTIVGATGKTNTIDGRFPGSGPVSFDINLSANRLTTKGIPVGGDVEFTVENFSQVFGTGNDDSITGDNQRNRLFGSTGNDNLSGLGGNDVMRGGSGNDVLNGGAGRDNLGGGTGNDIVKGGFDNDVLNGTAGGRNAGRNEVDTLTGGFAFAFAKSSDILTSALKQSSISGFRDFEQLNVLQKTAAPAASSSLTVQGDSRLIPTFLDRDTFVLGNSSNAFYLGDTAFGLSDYARITDFQSGVDTIQLNGGLDDYLLLGSSLIFRNNGSKGLDSKDDLIGVVEGTGFNLSGADFRFVA